ncbi:MAG: hypothetical protein JRN15_09360 [Nitrososphaerota archaeon]|nr:hypothetical protein [Nitrososphaerota archaeon]
MSDKLMRLTDFPYSNPGYGRKVAIVGVGSAGCKIASQLSKESKLLEHFVYVTCDEHDVANITKGEKILLDATASGRSSPYAIRGVASLKLPEIRRNIGDSEVVFIISGLGGAVGSGLAPLLAKEARSKGAVTIAIVVMPYNFERSKHFFAGGALKQLKSIASGLVVIDNDELLQNDIPIIDAYSIVNQKIALALNKLFGSAEQHEFSVGMSNIVNFLKNNAYSVLCLGDSGVSEYRQAVMNAVNHFDRIVDKREASKSIVHLCTDKTITPSELVSSIGGLSGVMGNGSMQIEYGLSANSSTCSTAIIMATGFSTTKFDIYDPVDAALGVRSLNLDGDLEYWSEMESLLTNIERD